MSIIADSIISFEIGIEALLEEGVLVVDTLLPSSMVGENELWVLDQFLLHYFNFLNLSVCMANFIFPHHLYKSRNWLHNIVFCPGDTLNRARRTRRDGALRFCPSESRVDGAAAVRVHAVRDVSAWKGFGIVVERVSAGIRQVLELRAPTDPEKCTCRSGSASSPRSYHRRPLNPLAAARINKIRPRAHRTP